jgi:hypothetical protein
MAAGLGINDFLFGLGSTQKGRDYLFGTPNELEKLPTGTKQQQQFGGNDLISFLQQMLQPDGGLQQANQYDLSLLQGGQQGFNQFAQPYNQQFEQQILPQIAERFAGVGALSSSGFGQAVGGAASDFQSKLAQLFTQLQGQAAQRQQSLFGNTSNTALGYEPFAYHEKQGQVGLLPQFGTAAIKAFSG